MSTVDDLQAAYNGESNARAKYLAFAIKADSEGFGGAASLFRAAAAAEEIHAANHAQVIKKSGGSPRADIKPATVGATKDNLLDAVKGETYERDVMYPGFIKSATGQKDALRTFNWALAAEAEHAKLYQLAHDQLEQWRGGGKTFWVCPVCGYTIADQPTDDCPVCRVKKEKFRTVN